LGILCIIILSNINRYGILYALMSHPSRNGRGACHIPVAEVSIPVDLRNRYLNLLTLWCMMEEKLKSLLEYAKTEASMSHAGYAK
jgi:hypothetical protein